MCPPPSPGSQALRIILEMFCLCINLFLIVKKYTGPQYIVLQQLLKTSFQGVFLYDSRQTHPGQSCNERLLGSARCLWVETWLALQHLTHPYTGVSAKNMFPGEGNIV